MDANHNLKGCDLSTEDNPRKRYKGIYQERGRNIQDQTISHQLFNNPYMKVRTKVMPPIFFLGMCCWVVSCLTHWIATLSSSIRIINDAVSPMCSTQ